MTYFSTLPQYGCEHKLTKKKHVQEKTCALRWDLKETHRAGGLPAPCSVNMAGGGIKRLHTETQDGPTETNLQ